MKHFVDHSRIKMQIGTKLLLDWMDIDSSATGHMEAHWNETTLTVSKTDGLWDGTIRFGKLIYKPKVQSAHLGTTLLYLETALFNLISGSTFPGISLDHHDSL